MNRRVFLMTTAAAFAVGSPASSEGFRFTQTEAEWRARLTPTQFAILRENATEQAFSSALHLETRAGVYACAGCDHVLYDGATKFYSDSGWPAFYEGVSGGVETGPDPVYGAILVEVHCANCGSHHGHIFNDGPEPTGERHCVNGAALVFRAA
jgi:peptide-methionine (R)-S-oxide reductase